MNNTLYLIRGCPGAGKSTFAAELSENLQCPHLEVDDYFIDIDGSYNFKYEELHLAHLQCQKECNHFIQYQNVIVSNTSTTEKEVKVYQDIAEKHGAKFVSIIVENRHNGVNLHGVPEVKVKQMRNRFSVKL